MLILAIFDVFSGFWTLFETPLVYTGFSGLLLFRKCQVFPRDLAKSVNSRNISRNIWNLPKFAKMSPTNLTLPDMTFWTLKNMIFDDFDTFHGDWLGVLSRNVSPSGPWCQNVSFLAKCVKMRHFWPKCLRIRPNFTKMAEIHQNGRNSLKTRKFTVLSKIHCSMGIGKGFDTNF